MTARRHGLREGGTARPYSPSRLYLILATLTCALSLPRLLLPVVLSLQWHAQARAPDQKDTAAAAVVPSDWKPLFTDNFEDGNAERWEMRSLEGSAGAWKIEAEGTNHFFSGEGFSWVTLAASSGRWADFRFKARVRLIQGTVLLNYRVSSAPYYYVSFRSTGVALSRTPNDTLLASVAAEYSSAEWHQIEIVGIGTNIKVYVDGTLKIDFTDTVTVESGTVGFEAPGDSHVHVDDVEISGPALLDELVWVKTGGPIGGLGYDVRMRPDNPDVMFVTDTFSGVNTSTDGGHTWVASNKGITSRAGTSGDAIPIFCLTIDPHNPYVVWAGTQNQRGIFKSMDGGKTWVEKDNGVVERVGIAFRGFTVDPRNFNTVYAAAEISSTQWAGEERLGREFDLTKGVVYTSVDGGESWTAIWRGDNLARYVWIDPRDSNVIYVSTGIFDREAANSDMLHDVPGGVGIVKSVDGGKTWRTLNGANGLTHLYISSLFMHPTNPDILLAGAGSIGSDSAAGGVFLSTDGGEHWQRGINSQTGQVVDGLITSVEFALSDPRVAYAAGANYFYRSSDAGRTWQLMSGGPPLFFYGPPGIRTGHPIDLQVDPRNPDRVFINNYGGGNFLSEDSGRTWQTASKGYTGAQLVAVAVDPRDSRRVLTIGRSGVFRSEDAGENWRGVNWDPATFSEWYTVVLDPVEPDRVIAADEHQGVLLQSLDQGASWQIVFRHPKVNANDFRARHGFKAVAFAPSDHRVVYAGMCRERRNADSGSPDPSFGVFKSTDGGRNWIEANDANTAGQNVNVLAVLPRNADIIYAGTIQGGVFQSQDGGRSWRPVNQGLPLRDVRALAIDTGNPSIIFAGLENGGVYKTTDGGAAWQSARSGMDAQAAIRDIVIDPANPQIVYAADLRTGVYRSDDGGKLWVQINKGLSTRAVKALAVSSDGGTLYAATEGEGVFRLDIQAPAEGAVSAVSSASFVPGGLLAPDSLASLFGQGLASATAVADRTPLPTTLSDVSVSITDSAGTDRWAPLFFVSPGQINLQIPTGTETGPATLRVFRGGQVIARGQATIEPVAPGLFTANADGKGVPAAVALRVSTDGAQTQLPVYQCAATPGSCAPTPIDLGPDTDQVILVLFGTGIRGASRLEAVSVRIGGVDAPVLYAGPQGQFVGLDQVNVRVPRELRGRGEIDLVLTVDGKTANVVRALFR